MVIGWGLLPKSESSRDGSSYTRKRVGACTHWYRRDSVAKSRSWQSAVFWVGAVYVTPVSFWAIKISKEKAVGAMCAAFSKGT